MAAAPPVFSNLFDDATKWDEPVPDYDALILLLGGVASTAAGAPALYNRGQTMMGLANLSHHSPTLIAFCPADDNKYIYVGHSISLYPTDPLNPLGFDANLITLVGDDPNSFSNVAFFILVRPVEVLVEAALAVALAPCVVGVPIGWHVLRADF